MTLYPAALPTGEPATLHIHLHTQHPCRLLTLHLPDDLAQGSHTVRAADPGWRTDHPRPGTVEMRPRHDAPPPAEGPLTVTVVGLRPDGVPGLREIIVTADLATGPGTPGSVTSRHPLHQLPAGTVPLSNFTAKPLNPGPKDQVELTWTGPQTGQYTLIRSDEAGATGENIQPKYKPGNSCSHIVTKRPTDAVVAFALVHGTDRALTWVMPQHGNIRAGSLSVKGAVTLLGAPTSLLKRAKGTQDKPYTAKTDGFVAVSLDTQKSQVSAELEIGSTVHRLSTGTPGAETHLQLPAPNGTTLTYRTKDTDALSTLTWFPLGTSGGGDA